MPGQVPRTALKYSFSQDGVKWVDLEALSNEVATKAADITGMLSGEPAKAYIVQAPGAVPVAEEEVSATTSAQCYCRLVAGCWTGIQSPTHEQLQFSFNQSHLLGHLAKAPEIIFTSQM